jgi:hypothetical protein
MEEQLSDNEFLCRVFHILHTMSGYGRILIFHLRDDLGDLSRSTHVKAQKGRLLALLNLQCTII